MIPKNMQHSISDKYTMTKIHKITDQILSFYECPEDCPAICCRNDHIPIYREEYRELKKICPGLQIMDTELSYMKLIVSPCPLLDENWKCRAYKKRPLVCRHFPILYTKYTPKEHLSVIPCKLGLLIFKDYIKFDFMRVESIKDEIGITEKDIEETKEKVRAYYLVLKEAFKEDTDPHGDIPGFYAPIGILEQFSNWLKKGKPEKFKFH